MRDTLFAFQEDYLKELHESIQNAHTMWRENRPQVITFSAPTGAGKTIMMTKLFEDILYGSADCDAQPDAIFVWLSDMPELNMQTRLKIEGKSDKIRVRDLITIDSTLVTEYLDAGCIYFLNTQKLGTDKLLTQKSDGRQYTIWETLTNTAQRQPKKFYVVIDEAHRGTYTSAQAEIKAQSIMQKFIKGNPEGGLCAMPLIIGVTATPQRFQRLIADTPSTEHKVIVPPEAVRDSGLLKDRIIIHYPEIAINADMTMFQSAVNNWKRMRERWLAYCEQENEKIVKPILVIQVEDGTDTVATRTDLNECLHTLEETLGRQLHPGEVVHTFNDHASLTVNGMDIPPVEASRIEENDDISVVFFKMNLSTGWDCPRAETMMSFRSAQDSTFIAQLLGRMIRTPLARRIESDAELNSVGLYLPYFNEVTVKNVIKALQESEAATPAETGTSKHLITLIRNAAYADVFAAMTNLITYRIETARKLPALRRLIQLARALTQDAIDLEAQATIKRMVLDKMDEEIVRMKQAGEFDSKAATITGFEMGTLVFDYGEEAYTLDASTETMKVMPFDITGHFNRAGKRLGEGVHTEYWIRHSRRDHVEVHIEIIVLANDPQAMQNIEDFAEAKFLELYEMNQRAIGLLGEARRDGYNKLIRASTTPIAMAWVLPNTIDFNESSDSEAFDRHLFLKEDGTFQASLDPWEKGVLMEELRKGGVAWLRNLPRKGWSLEIPYKSNGVTTPMFPDLIIVRRDQHGFIFDVLEPHDPSRTDNYPKAVGLAEFANLHWNKFGRIQLIRKQRSADGHDHFYRLDMAKVAVRNRVRAVTSNSELDQVFAQHAVIEE